MRLTRTTLSAHPPGCAKVEVYENENRVFLLENIDLGATGE